MDGYNLPYFKGVPRQRGRGFGALARTVARTTLPIFKKYVLHAAKKNWKRCNRVSHSRNWWCFIRTDFDLKSSKEDCKINSTKTSLWWYEKEENHKTKYRSAKNSDRLSEEP